VRITRSIILSLLVLGAVPAFARAEWLYNYHTFDVPGARSTSPLALNDLGQVVGTYTPGFQANFFKDGSSFAPVGLSGQPFGINASEQVLINSGGPLIYDRNTQSTSGPFNPPGTNFFGATGHGFNNLGDIAGNFINTSSKAHSFLYKQGVGYTVFNLTGIPASAAVTIWGLNDNDDMVGVENGHGFLFDGTTLTLINYPGATSTTLRGINNHGLMVGQYTLGSSINSFITDGVNFAPISFPGAASTRVTGINNEGEIVGSYFFPNGASHTHGFFATAVPEPSSLVLAGTAGVVGLGLRAWRRRKPRG
jgi:hypothetical protein